MALQYPSIVPVGYAGDYTDFLKTKSDQRGSVRLITGSVTVPASTVSGTIVGLFPFQRGFKLSYGSWFSTAAQGTSVTLALGYYYEDSALSSVTNGYLTASSNAAAGGLLTPAVTAGATVDVTAKGWVVALVGGATTTGPAAITFNALFAYDQSGVTN